MKTVLPNDLFYNILDIMIQNYSKNGDNIQEIKEFYSLNKSLKNIVSSKKQAILKAHFRYSKANDKDFYSNIIDLKYFKKLNFLNIEKKDIFIAGKKYYLELLKDDYPINTGNFLKEFAMFMLKNPEYIANEETNSLFLWYVYLGYTDKKILKIVKPKDFNKNIDLEDYFNMNIKDIQKSLSADIL
jgi:hypothetical protein